MAFLFSMLALSTQGYAQKTIISGRVTDATSNEPLPFVNIGFKNSKVGTTTDLNGFYRIETYYATDSLIASFVGYQRLAKKVKLDVEQTIHFQLRESTVRLGEVVISAKNYENPAHVILRNVIRNKPVNNRAKLDAYEYETYNKIQFDINNFGEKFTKRRLFRDFDFIFDNIDSTREKVALPFFITETISDYYYQRKPRGRKEIIRATKVSGINNESISQFLGQMYQDVNVYENSIGIFGKNFVSPISAYGLVFYRYYLVDSAYIDKKWCYRLDFLPKNETDLVFEGHMWINDTTFAVKEIEARILRSANINFINNLKVIHSFNEVEPEVWMINREELIADFNLLENEMGFYGHKVTTYRNFVINQPKDPEFYSGADFVIVQSQVNEKDESYWKNARHEAISSNQQAIYDMVDSLKGNARFMTYIDIINFIFTGYHVTGQVELGPVFTFLSYNTVEGVRPKFGMRTSNDFSTKVMLEGYAAYGTRDQRVKYMIGGTWIPSKKPRQTFGAYYSEDMELIGQVVNFFPRDHWVLAFSAPGAQDRLIFQKKGRLFTEREWFTGFSTLVELSRKELFAVGDWSFERLPQNVPDPLPQRVRSITASEVSVGVRFAYRESFVSGEFERVSLGSKYPILTARLDMGVKGLLDGEYEYQRLTLNAYDRIPLGPFGNVQYTMEAGKTWGAIPFPLQFVHAGNPTLFLNSKAFNTMNFFEFVSDRYASLRGEYHLDGLFLNKVPLFKRLKWRELVGVNAIYGKLGQASINEVLLPDRTFAFTDRPYVEAFVGIENIFKFLRVDAIWRLSYLDNPDARKFGLLIGFNLQF
jgi:hypothetical protein